MSTLSDNIDTVESDKLAQQIEEELRRINGDKTFNELVELEKQTSSETVTDTQRSLARVSGALIGVAIGLTAVSLIQPEFLPLAALAGGAVIIINYSGDIIRIAKVTGEIIADAAKPGWDKLVNAFKQAKEKSPELRAKILEAWRRASTRLGELVQNGVTGLKTAAKTIREKGQEYANKLKRKDKNNTVDITNQQKLENPVIGGMERDMLENPVLDGDRWKAAILNKVMVVCVIAIILLTAVFPESGARTVGLVAAVGVLVVAAIAYRVLRVKSYVHEVNEEGNRAIEQHLRETEAMDRANALRG
ncbi:hypothetical protein E24_00052 [Faustovirus]|nr:putative phosphatidylglycerophosphate synthase [Faustovirus]AMN82986.1 hypothetical protein E24_00052 [Faustovirus]AMN83973.1 hypothetical protein D5a_00052 [Faustovirus]AMN84956.1 hypothetical protein E23_00052 [Faustovirus]QBR98961.1 putative phosphatidylglycerophosphate synthase [Faustovirus mariensis]